MLALRLCPPPAAACRRLSFLGSALMLRAALFGPVAASLGTSVGLAVVIFLVLRATVTLLTLVRQLGCNLAGTALDYRNRQRGYDASEPMLATEVVVLGGSEGQQHGTGSAPLGEPTTAGTAGAPGVPGSGGGRVAVAVAAGAHGASHYAALPRAPARVAAGCSAAASEAHAQPAEDDAEHSPTDAAVPAERQAAAAVAVAHAQPMPQLAYRFSTVRRRMNTKAAMEANDTHAGLVLAADTLASAIIVSSAAYASAALSAIVTWSLFAVAVHALLLLLIDATVFRVARLRLVRSRELLGAVALETACVFSSAFFVAGQFREAVAPVAGQQVSDGFGELADAVYSASFTPSGIVQLLVFIGLLLLFLAVARLSFSAEYALLDLADARRTGALDRWLPGCLRAQRKGDGGAAGLEAQGMQMSGAAAGTAGRAGSGELQRADAAADGAVPAGARWEPQLQQIETAALALSYGGYCCAHSLIFVGLLDCLSDSLSAQVVSMLTWMALAACALLLSQATSNLVLLRRVASPGRLLRQNNVAAALVDVGHSLAAGLIIQAAVSGESAFLEGGIVGFCLYYAASQLLFLAFSLLYQALTRYNDIQLLARGNAAAGVGHCLSQVALGYMLASPVRKGASLVQFCYQAAISMVLQLLARLFVDRALLPRRALDLEIEEDLNWGAALIEGGFALGVAVFLEALLPDAIGGGGCNQLVLDLNS